jgi:hypothetical protein
MRLGLVGSGVLMVLLSGCTSVDSEAPEATPTATVTVTETASVIEPEPEPTPSEDDDPYAPNVGDRALRIGDTRVGEAVRTTLKSVKYPYPPDYAREPDAGNDFVGLEIEQCFNRDAQVDSEYPDTTTYNGDWVVLSPKGFEFGGDGSSWSDWPSPKFPETVTLNPGRCYKGWISLQVPKGTKIASLVWRPAGTETAEWLPKK